MIGLLEQSSTSNTISSFFRDDIIINTKIGRYEAEPTKQFDYSYETMIHSVERSLQRMKCQYINVLQLHDLEFLFHDNNKMDILLMETIPAMIKCQKRGYTRALGMTGYPLQV